MCTSPRESCRPYAGHFKPPNKKSWIRPCLVIYGAYLLYAPNWRLYDGSDVVYVTYGIFDAITLAINGVMAVSSISGKLTNPIGFSEIRKKIVIIPDLGEDKEAHILASRVGWRGKVAHIIYPEGCKDLNDMWMRNQEEFKEMLNELG